MYQVQFIHPSLDTNRLDAAQNLSLRHIKSLVCMLILNPRVNASIADALVSLQINFYLLYFSPFFREDPWQYGLRE